MTELSTESWDLLEKHVRVFLKRDRRDLSDIVLARPVYIVSAEDTHVFEPGVYTRAA